MKKFWQYVRDRIWPPSRLQYAVTILLCLITAGVSLFRQDFLVSIAALAALSAAISWLLLDTKVELDEVQELKVKLDGVLGRYSMGILKFEDYIPSIKEALSAADEVWLLTASGVGWFYDFPELENVIDRAFRRGAKCRFLLLDPRNEKYRDYAVQMAFERTDFRKALFTFQNYNHYREHTKNQIFTLFNKYNEKAEFKVIDHLPSWVLLIIQPQDRDSRSTVFVEFRPFMMGFRGRPVMKVVPGEGEWFDWFVEEFNDIWNHERAQALASQEIAEYSLMPK